MMKYRNFYLNQERKRRKFAYHLQSYYLFSRNKNRYISPNFLLPIIAIKYLLLFHIILVLGPLNLSDHLKTLP